MDDVPLNQIEYEHISTALEVEKLEVNLFRSKTLWLPMRGRGVFGGQVISQALVAATECVDRAFGLHSLHCYFLTSASPSTPIVYFVEQLRQGRSYATFSVKAVQNGGNIFILLCSFQKPEPWQPSHQWHMPVVPMPEELELEEEAYMKAYKESKFPPEANELLKEYAQERARSPISVKVAKKHDISPDGVVRYMYWMKAKMLQDEGYDAQFQKGILSYMSDLYLIGTAARVAGMKYGVKGPGGRGMMSTIDHTISFYNDDFDCSEWLLYVMSAPRMGSGRAITHGQFYTREGNLIALSTQEGVMRANVRDPNEKAKL